MEMARVPVLFLVGIMEELRIVRHVTRAVILAMGQRQRTAVAHAVSLLKMEIAKVA